jgi:hypothetical protein
LQGFHVALIDGEREAAVVVAPRPPHGSLPQEVLHLTIAGCACLEMKSMIDVSVVRDGPKVPRQLERTTWSASALVSI